MKHGILAALSAVLSKPMVLFGSGADPWRVAVSRIFNSAWLLTHPRTSLALTQVFVSPRLLPLLRIERRLMFGFLSGYLATDLSRSERAAMLLHHYTFLKARARRDFVGRLAKRRLELWKLVVGENAHRIYLSFPRMADGEGDLALIFEANGIDLYTLSFTVGPGAIAGVDTQHAMYIARVQGRGKELDRIREATKSCHDVSPAMLLLAAAEGIAQALDLEKMVGIGADTQMSTNSGRRPEELIKAYDEFWTAVGGLRLARNMYQLEVPRLGKPILSVKRVHRSRTHRKRRFKKALKEEVREGFRTAALRSATGRHTAPESTAATDATEIASVQ